MADRLSFDVLVIGSGASGLAAARGRRAGRRPGRARDQGLAPVVQLGQGAGRDPGLVRRGRLARDPRRGRLEELARDGRHAARRGADRRRAERDPLARGAGRRSSRGRTAATGSPAAAARPESACSRSATAPATRSRPALREAWEAGGGTTLAEEPAGEPRAGRERLARALRRARDRRRRGRPRRRRPLLPRGRGARRALHQPPGRDRRGDADRARPRRRGARPRRAPVPPERRRLAGEHAGLLDPGDDARVRRRAPQHSTARSSPTRSARATRSRRRSSTRSRRGTGSRRPTAGLPCCLDTTRIPEADADVSLPYMLRRYRAAGIDPLVRADLHLPCAPLPERRPRDRHRRRDDARRALRLRRDRGRHARPQPDDGQLPARVLRLRAQGREGSSRKEQTEHHGRHRSLRRRRGRRGAPVRLGAEGHPAGPARRARGRGRP